MTPAAQTVVDLCSEFSMWVASHIIAGGEIVRQLVPVAIVFGFVHLTPEQQAVLFSSVSGIVAAVTGQGTVSKPRVGERITEGVDRELVSRGQQPSGNGGSGGGTGI
jgi:hypothetical protein